MFRGPGLPHPEGNLMADYLAATYLWPMSCCYPLGCFGGHFPWSWQPMQQMMCSFDNWSDYQTIKILIFAIQRLKGGRQGSLTACRLCPRQFPWAVSWVDGLRSQLSVAPRRIHSRVHHPP